MVHACVWSIPRGSLAPNHGCRRPRRPPPPRAEAPHASASHTIPMIAAMNVVDAVTMHMTAPDMVVAVVVAAAAAAAEVGEAAGNASYLLIVLIFPILNTLVEHFLEVEMQSFSNFS